MNRQLSAVTTLIAAGCLATIATDATAQVTDVRAAPGNGELVLTFAGSEIGAPHDVYLATESGVTANNFRTLEGGRSVENIGSPLTIRGLENNRDHFIVVVERAAGGAASSPEIVGTPRGAWLAAEATSSFRDVATDPQTDGLAIAAGGAAGGCQVSPKPAGCDIFRSTDGGRTWAIASEEIATIDPRAVVIHGGVGLVLSKNVGVGDEILRSTDGGDGWLSVLSSVNDTGGLDRTFAFDRLDPTTVFAANLNLAGASEVARSIDGGQTWGALPQLPVPGVLNARAIAVDPASSSVVWLGGPGTPRLARSTNGGNAWTEVVITVIGLVQDIVFDPVTPTKIWLADESQVYGSQNGGAVFTPRMDGFEAGTQIRALARDGADQVLYVGTSTGVYESRDDGRTFAKIGINLNSPVVALAFSSAPKGLIAATAGGLYHLDMVPAGPVMPMLDAGVDGGDGGPGDGGCGCRGAGAPSGGGVLLLVIAVLFAVRERGVRVVRRLARRPRE